MLTTHQSIQVFVVATHTVRNTHTRWDNLPWTPRLALFLPAQIYPYFITHSPCQRSLTIRHSYVSSLKLFYHSLRPPGIPIHKPKFVLPNSQNPPEHSGMSQESHPGTVQIIQHLSTHTHRPQLSHSFVQGLERVNTNKQMGQLARGERRQGWRSLCSARSSLSCETKKLRNHPSGWY